MIQMVKSLSAVWETRIPSLGREDPLEKEMATRSSILAWKIPWAEEPGRLQFTGLKGIDVTEHLHFHVQVFFAACGLSPVAASGAPL